MSIELKKADLLKYFTNGAMMISRPLWQSPDYGRDIATSLEGDWIAVGKDISRVGRRIKDNEKKES